MKRHYGIRTNGYKLIHFYNDVDEWELYDMTKDPKEMQNVYDMPEYAQVREELKSLLRKTQEQYGDTDPDEKEKVLFRGDRRFMERKD